MDVMEEFVAYIVKNLVADPEAVEIRSVEDEAGESIKLEIRVAPEDIGKIIGRRGNTIHALRTILRRVCARLKKKIQVDLIQPESGQVINEELSGDYVEAHSPEEREATAELSHREAPSEKEEEAMACQGCGCPHHVEC